MKNRLFYRSGSVTKKYLQSRLVERKLNLFHFGTSLGKGGSQM